MPQGLKHRIILVGVDPDTQVALRAALRTRLAEPAEFCQDLAAARQSALARPGEMHLFIVQLAAVSDPGRLSSLTGALPGQPVLALLPPESDLTALLAAQRAGAAQVVPLPLQQDDVLRALDCILTQFTPTVRDSRVIAVCGVVGGAGGTTVALNLACEIGQLPAMTTRSGCLLVELARQMGALATYLNIQPPLTTHELLSDVSRLNAAGIRQSLTQVMPGVDVLVGPYQDITLGAISQRHVYQLLELARRLASVVVLDVPSVFDDLYFETLALADQVVLVGVQTVSSVRTLKMIRETLEREEGVQDAVVVINRYDPNARGFTIEELTTLLGGEQILTVANDYPSVMTALNHGKPLRLTAPGSPVLTDLRNIASSLIGPTTPPPSPGVGELLRPKAAGPRVIRALHIEDDPLQHYMISLYLSAIPGLRCTTRSVASETEAIVAFRTEPFDVVLLDFHLSQGNGLSCLRQLRALNATVPILVISGLSAATVAADLLDAGADDFLSKDSLSSELIGRSLWAALARADAVRRRGDQQTGSAQGTAKRPSLVVDDTELMRSLSELRQKAAGRLSVAKVQHAAALLANELGGAVPQRALLTLFLRLFGSDAS